MNTVNYIKSFSGMNTYKHLIWPLVLIISIAGFWYPVLGLLMYPMLIGIMFTGFWSGRYWCGNFCPRGAFLDAPVKKITKLKKIEDIFKNNISRFTVMIILMSFFLFNVFKAFDYWGKSVFLDKLGMAGVMMCAITTVIALVLAVFVNPRAWCSFCPMGTVQRELHRFKNFIYKGSPGDPKITLLKPDNCSLCRVCVKSCPMQINILEKVNEKKQLMDRDCIKCGTCIPSCSNKVIGFNARIN